MLVGDWTFPYIEMIGDGLTITWSFRSCQCVECDLAIHSLIWRIQRESKAKCFILYYINCCLAKFEGGIRTPLNL